MKTITKYKLKKMVGTMPAAKVAKALSVSRQSIYLMMKKHGIKPIGAKKVIVRDV